MTFTSEACGRVTEMKVVEHLCSLLCVVEYPLSVPIWYLRLIPAVFGSFLPIAAYYLMLEFNLSRWTAALAAALIIMGMEMCCMLSFCL